MKKEYKKPEAMFEAFQQSEDIAVVGTSTDAGEIPDGI